MSIQEFFHMGGHGFYIWTSYGLGLVILVYNAISPVIRRRQILAALARKLRFEKETA